MYEGLGILVALLSLGGAAVLAHRREQGDSRGHSPTFESDRTEVEARLGDDNVLRIYIRDESYEITDFISRLTRMPDGDYPESGQVNTEIEIHLEEIDVDEDDFEKQI